MKFFFLLIGFIGSFGTLFSQLEMSPQGREKSWINTKSPTQVSLEFQWNQAYRNLSPNASFLNKPLGELANEKSSDLWCYGLNMQTGFGKWLRFEGGVQFLQNGESYQFIDAGSDSTYQYVSRYRYLGLPLALNVQYGHRLRFFAGPGINPLIFNKYKKDITWTTASGSDGDSLVKLRNNSFSSSVIQLYAQAGLQYTSDNGWGWIIKGIYRTQLNNTYSKYSEVIHKPYAWGFSFGILKTL